MKLNQSNLNILNSKQYSKKRLKNHGELKKNTNGKYILKKITNKTPEDRELIENMM